MIFNHQLTASSERDSRHGAKHGRLHGNSAWCSARSSLPKYFQVYIFYSNLIFPFQRSLYASELTLFDSVVKDELFNS